MKHQFRILRITQLDRALKPFKRLQHQPRPPKGWISALRQAIGVSERELARRLGKAPSVAFSYEKSEAEYRITLGSLRKVADALGCQLVYALVPKDASVQELYEQRARAQAAENVRAVEHTMVLEDQAVGQVEKKIEEETKRLLKRIRHK